MNKIGYWLLRKTIRLRTFQMTLVHKGGKIKNWVWECRDVTPTKSQSQNIFKEHWGSGWGGGQDGCERRINVSVNIQKKNIFFFFFFFFWGGGVGSGWGGSG